MATYNTPRQVYSLKVLKIYGIVKNERGIFLDQMKYVWLDSAVSILCLIAHDFGSLIYYN